MSTFKFTSENPFNVRSIMINPSGAESIKYYVCLIDLPPDVSIDNFSAGIQNLEDGGDGTILSYTYTGTLPTITDKTDTSTWTTNLLPVFTNQGMPEFGSQINQTTIDKIKIYDTNTGSQAAKSKGNVRRPPIVDFLEKDPNWVSFGNPSVLTIQSTSNPVNYFLSVIINTGPNGGYTNLINQFQVKDALPLILYCSLTPNPNLANRVRAAFGVYPCTYTQFNTVEFTLDDTMTEVKINWPIYM